MKTNRLHSVLVAIFFLTACGGKGQPEVGTGTPEGEVILEGDGTGERTVLVVNAATVLGDKPFVMRYGVQAGSYTPNRVEAEAIARVQPGTWKTYLWFHWMFDSESSLPPTAEDWTAFDGLVDQAAQALRAVKDRGFRIVVYLDGWPRWLSGCPENEEPFLGTPWMRKWMYCPPADMQAWADMTERMARRFAAHDMHPYYSVGNEPTWEVVGTEEDYMQIYRWAAEGIRMGDPLALVGGPCSHSFGAPKEEYVEAEYVGMGERPLLQVLIEEGGSTPVPENGWDRLPIDFVCWHYPTTDPGGGEIEGQVDQVRAWLAAAGYDPETTVLIGEWTHPTHGDLAASEVAASYAASMIQVMTECGVDMQIHTSDHDNSGWSDGGWTHVGLFSRYWPCEPGVHATMPSSVVRSKFNAFVLAGMTGETQVELTHEDEFLEASAWTDESGALSVLISNFIPPDIVRRGIDVVRAILTTEEAGQVEDCVRDLAANGRPGSALLLDYLDRCLEQQAPFRREEVIAAIEAFSAIWQDRQEQELAFTLRVDGLDSGELRVTRFAVDGEHANMCRYNKRTEPAPTESACGEGGAVDQAGQRAMDRALGDMQVRLVANGWTMDEAEAMVQLLPLQDELCQFTSQFRSQAAAILSQEQYVVLEEAMGRYGETREASGPEAAWYGVSQHLLNSGLWTQESVALLHSRAIVPLEDMLVQVDHLKAALTPEHQDQTGQVLDLFRQGPLETRMLEEAAMLNAMPEVGMVEPVEVFAVISNGAIELDFSICPYCVWLIRLEPTR